MMKKWLLIPLILIPVLAAMSMGVNMLSPKPTNQLDPGRCTRYCHSVTCPHVKPALQQKGFTQFLWKRYQNQILWLRHNPLGLSYRDMNLLYYVVGYPVVILLLIWGLLRKRHG